MTPTSPNRRSTSLKIHAAPFKPSRLSIPPSPSYPRTPLPPDTIPPTHPSNEPYARTVPAPDPSFEKPPSPLQWLWQCHQCHRTYGLGVTRRCLEDGHVFCAGTTTIKDWRKAVNPRKKYQGPGTIRRHKACGSEFDYQGWKEWGRWRRSGRKTSSSVAVMEDEADLTDDSMSTISTDSLSSFTSLSSSEGEEEAGLNRSAGTSPSTSVTSLSSSPQSTSIKQKGVETPHKDCWNTCDYPSECRWGRRYGIHTPLTTEFPVSATTPALQREGDSPSTIAAGTGATTFEGILNPENIKAATSRSPAQNTSPTKSSKTDFWGALVASATRRKSIPPSSPLANTTEVVDSTPSSSSDQALPITISPSLLTKDADGDIVMSGSSTGTTPSSQSSASIFTLPNPSTLTLTSTITNTISGSAPVVTLREMIKKSKRVKTSHTQTARPGSPIVTSANTPFLDKDKARTGIMTRSKSKSPLQLETVIEEGDGGSRELNFEVVNTQGFAADDSMGDMPPLKRVQSRDGGYCSVGVPEKGRSQSV